MTAIRIIGCGSHVAFKVDPHRVKEYLDVNLVTILTSHFGRIPAWHIDVIAEGGADGGDRGFKLFAEANGINHIQMRAEWARYGWSAGPKRNREMFNTIIPHIVIAFPGGPGTHNMCDYAERQGCLVHRITGDFKP
jgi:hypothetical protein